MWKSLEKFGQLLFSKTTKVTSLIFLGNLFASIFGIIFTILVARFLGPESWGIVAAVISFITILVAFGDLGLGASLFRFMSRALSEGEGSKAREILGIIFSLRLIATIFLLVSLFIISPWLAPLVTKTNENLLIVWAAFGIAGSLLIDFQITSLEAKQDWRLAAVFITLTNLLRILGVYIAVSQSYLSISTTVAVFAVSPLSAFFLSLIVNKPALKVSKGWQKIVKDVVPFSSWLAVNRMVSAITSRIDILLLLHLSNPLATGIFAAARQLANGVPIVVGSFATVIAPGFASYQGGVLKESFKKTLWLSIIIALGILTGVFLAPSVMSLFGDKYATAVPVLQWLLVAYIPFALSTATVNILIYAFSKPKIITILSLCQLPLIVLGNIYLIPQFGVYGPVWIIGLWNLSTLVVTGIFTWHYLKKL
ncbi:oligosaccharide flippase family protein [Candidatus Microgenomates bacterium]|nr:oligosaccharide flippase family protein [Candidatus Microgenomates bacterium]